MSLLPRIASYLALFLALAVGAQLLQGWLQRQSAGQLRVLQDAAIADAKNDLAAAFAAAQLSAASPRMEFVRIAALEGVALEFTDTPAATVAGGSAPALSFAMTPFEGVNLRGSVPIPPTAKLLIVYQRVTAGLLLVCPLFFLVGVLIASLPRRATKEERGARLSWPTARAEAAGFEQLAKISHERTQALEQEQKARRRAEEDSQVNRSMLDHSLDERARLGRELHDNICQTLYAVCLTLESVQRKNALSPELRARVDQCMSELKRVNHEVRAYLRDLEPGRIHELVFDGALRALLSTFSGRGGLVIENRLTPEVVARIAPSHVGEVMNILRESISNAVRHGAANKLSLRAAGDERFVVISIHDDGRGFAQVSVELSGRGHGLSNMQARALELGGMLAIESEPGKGTRVVLTLPAASAT